MSDKKVTPSELKLFIEAVEFASDAEAWIPNARQWSKIRQMIENLVDVQPEIQSAPQFRPTQYEQPVQMQLPIPTHSQLSNMPVNLPPVLATNNNTTIRTPNIDTSSGQSYQSSFA